MSEVRSVLALTPEQWQRFEEWSRARLAALAQQFDVDTTVSRERVSSGMRIASLLGALAISAALILFFDRYWGFLDTWMQLAIVIPAPVVFLCAAEWMARRETARYLTGLLALVALAAFVLNLVVVGSVFNIVSSERALLPWGAFSLLLGYRYGLRLMLAMGLTLLISWLAAAYTARIGYPWLDFYDRPEYFLPPALLTFVLPLWLRHERNTDFRPIWRLVGALTFLIADLSLAEWGAPSYLPSDVTTIERSYEIAGLIVSAGAIWLGIRRNWNETVNTGAIFFTVFLFTRLYHWWWD